VAQQLFLHCYTLLRRQARDAANPLFPRREAEDAFTFFAESRVVFKPNK